MTIEEFVKKAKEQDSRNYFEPFEGDMFNIPPDIKEFYIRANPVDVEIRTKNWQPPFLPFGRNGGYKKEYSFMPKDVLFLHQRMAILFSLEIHIIILHVKVDLSQSYYRMILKVFWTL